MIKFKSNQIHDLAQKLTVNSELFGDEIASVTMQLTSLSNIANYYGCPFEGKVTTGWGDYIDVTAMPDKRRHSWTF